MANISIAGHVGGIASGFLLSYLIIRRDKSITTEYSTYNDYNYNVVEEDNEDKDDDIWNTH